MIPTMLLVPYDYEIVVLNIGSRQVLIKVAKDLGQPYGVLRYDEG